MEMLEQIARSFYQNVIDTVLLAGDPNQRIFVLYLLSAVIIAFLIFKSAKARLSSDEQGFLGFLFPKSVWSHPSAWLDLRYFFFHRIFGKFLLLGLSAWAMAMTFRFASGGVPITQAVSQTSLSTGADILITLGFMVVAVLVSDFLGWYCHYLQHKSPILWQFHKVHHSAEVMHPVSNYREHPIDNFLYLLVTGAGIGILFGGTLNYLGYLPNRPSLFGVPILVFLFNVVGYNLRHSHVWLRWPGRLSMIFPSPAHHHVHHSCHPDHLDKNFAFMFPIWDVIFGTYEMPEDNRDVKFGIGEGNADELTSCTRLYWVPFRDAFRVFQAKRRGLRFNMSKPEPVAKASERGEGT